MDFWTSNHTTEELNGYECSRFKVAVEAHVKRKQKVSKRFDQTFEQYFENCEIQLSPDP